MIKLRKCDWVLLLLAVLAFLGSLSTFIVFPIVYPQSVKSHLQFKHNEDMSLKFSAFMFTHPPTTTVMEFYFFNITNPDEMTYFGAKPMLVEVGPYTVIESEEKKYLKWKDDDSQIFYQNYKKYVINEEQSCPTCNFKNIVTIPNPTETGAAADMFDPKYNVNEQGRIIITIGLMILGEYPFVNQKVGDILFDGYDDALLSAAHSRIISLVNDYFGYSVIPIPVPAMERMGFFQGYNNTADESYWVQTGKNDINRIGEVVTWANVSSLPEDWWTTDHARSIRGTDSASFCKMHLTKTDVLPGFQSFQCRSFDATYLKDETVRDIPGYVFSVPESEYDTTLDKNRGFRYRNVEKVNYYEDWPKCPERDVTQCDPSQSVDCSVSENLCHNCCNGSLVNGTYLLPPGIFPLVCYPGRLQPSPYSVMYSPPHFLYSPPEMVNSVYGLNPNYEVHRPMVYTHEPYSGSIIKVIYQLMVSTPLYANPLVVPNMHLPNTIVPMFWQGAKSTLYDSVYQDIWLGFVFVPKFMAFFKYFLLALSFFFIALTVLCVLRRSKTSEANDNVEEPTSFSPNCNIDDNE